MFESFQRATSGLGPAEWRLLGVIACEKRLDRRAMEEVAPGHERSFVGSCVEHGVIVDAGPLRSPGVGRSEERTFAIAEPFRPLVLRRLSELSELDAVRHLARPVSGDMLRSAFLCALYAGDLAALERVLPELARRAARGQDPEFASDMLREALSSPLDAAWLERAWGEHAPRLIEQALADTLYGLEPSEPLYRFALERLDDDAAPSFRCVLAEHALLRGDVERVLSLLKGLELREQSGFRAAAAYVAARLPEAQRLLSDHDHARGSAMGAASVTALLTLLALSRDADEGAKLARRCLPRGAPRRVEPLRGYPASSAEPDVSRALRVLIKRSSQPEGERLRLSAHQLPTHAPPWEALVTALTVLLHERDEVTRAGWARRLATIAEATGTAGYSWFSRQAAQVARALGHDAAPEPHGAAKPGELSLCDLIEPEPEWRRALVALKGFGESIERSADVLSRRVAWYVDMTSGAPAKPALEEFQQGTGWTRGRRVDLDELDAVAEALPAEDRAVLAAVANSRRNRHGLPMELLEALCGHPRVFNGARGRLQVEVSHGTCRIETRREHGHLVIAVEPAGASEGVNVVVESETRLVVYRVTPTLAKLIRLVPSGVRIPERHQAEAVAVLSKLAEHVEVRSADLAAARKRAAESTPVLRISPESGAWWVEAGVRPFGASGRFFPPGLGRASVTMHAGDDWVDAERDLELECSRFEAVVGACPSLGRALGREAEPADRPEGEVFSGSLGEEGLFALLVELEASGLECAIEWQDGRPVTSRGTLRAAALHGALKRIKGWYLVTGGVDIEGLSYVSFSELVRFPFTKSGRFLRLPNGDFVEVERRARRVLALLASGVTTKARGRAPAELRIPDVAFATLRSLRDAESGIELDAGSDAWLRSCERILASEPAIPDGLCATLRSYQVDGFRFLARASELGLGVCLADDMGLGKTLQAIALLLTRRTGGAALVVAPTSVCRNWLEELRRFAPDLIAREYYGKDRKKLLDELRADEAQETMGAGRVVIASYALLQQDAEELAELTFHTVVLDEAQFIKNAHSLRARAAYGLSARHRLAMTGTPVENHLGDLWSIFHFLNPTLLGAFKEFQVRYLKPIERDRDSERSAELKALVAPFLLRRSKDDVLPELPPITVVDHAVRLNEDEALRYALLRRDIHDKLHTSHGKREHKLQVFAELTRLRRFCCHPRLVFPDAPTESSKLSSFIELVEELRENGHRALVFSQFVDYLQIVREALDERGLRYLYLDGSTPKETRHARVTAFQNGEAELFLISLKAGGFGLNLTAADYVIHLDPWWNPAVEAQATDRAHRIGQERPVTVYRLVTADTIEESIVALHAHKQELASALLDDRSEAVEVTSKLLLELVGGPSGEP
jgi:superfamily II DNA or RNA helicase